MNSKTVISLLATCVLIIACTPQTVTEPPGSDAQLQSAIAVALANSSDLPPALQVNVAGGIATISGSLACEECEGNVTPGSSGTVQQSIGAVVRAVPGVSRVEFVFSTDP